MATSGTVSTVVFTNQKIVDHAMRRAGFVPQRVAGEALDVALDLLYTITSEYVNVGMPLWTQEYELLGIQPGSPDVSTPPGTVDILHAYWRIFNPWRGAATLSDTTSGTVLFAGQPNADVVIPGPNAYVEVNFTSQTEVDTIGILLGGNTEITTELEVLASNDGITFVSVQTLPSATYTPMQWTYFDLDPSLTYQYLRLRYNSADDWTLNQLNFLLANGQDIEAGPLSIDDYYNLPNKQFQTDQPLSCYTDRQVDTPVLKIWPTPNTTAFYNGTITALMRRYIQDPGTLTDTLEVPQRWMEAIIWRLASRLIIEIPDDWTGNISPITQIQLQIRQDRKVTIDTEAAKSEALAWGEERTRGPIRLMPSISPYTR